MKPSFYRRYGILILALTALSLPVVLHGAYRAVVSNANNPDDWLPADFSATQDYRWFNQRFGGDEILVVSWPGCTTDDPRLDDLVDELLPPEGDPRARQQPRWFARAYTGPSVIHELTSEPVNLSEEEAIERMKGWLVGPDGQTSCAVLTVTYEGAMNRHAAVAAVVAAAKKRCGLTREELRFGGPTMDSVAIDNESNKSLYRLTALSVVLSILLAWLFLKSIHLMIIVFLTSTLCECWTLALVHWLGYSMDSVLIMMPAMIYVLTISAAIHLLNYFAETIVAHGWEGGVVRAVAHSWLPTAQATATTAIGLGSLMVSQIVPIFKFGMFSAIGVVLSFVFLYVVMPAMLEWWPRLHRSLAHGSSRFHKSQVEVRSWSEVVAEFAMAHYRTLTVVALLATGLLACGLPRIQTSVKLQNMFTPRSRVLQDYAWLEDHLGPLVPVEVVLKFDALDPRTPLARLELVERVRASVVRTPGVGGSMSLATFIEEVPQGRGGSQFARRTAITRMMKNKRGDLLATGFLAEDPNGGQARELWRISLRVVALDDRLDYGEFVERLKADVDKLLAAEALGTPAAGADAKPSPVEVVVCGGVPLISIVQRTLMDSLKGSFGTALLLIVMTMMIALRSVAAGLIVMLPNIFPTIVILGGMGWYGTKVDLGSMMTVSTALGIAVDNELHFFTWFRRGLSQGLGRRGALRMAFQRCAGAMSQTALICGLGLSIFASSPFVPTARFGWLMCALLLAAMVGDLLILPSLLTGPLGRFYERGFMNRQKPPHLTGTHKPLAAAARAGK